MSLSCLLYIKGANGDISACLADLWNEYFDINELKICSHICDQSFIQPSYIAFDNRSEILLYISAG